MMSGLIEEKGTTAEMVAFATPVKDRKRACVVRIHPAGYLLDSRHVLEDEVVLLGRDDDCDIRVGDPAVSRFHARIEIGVRGYMARDLQSTNGTFVNDRPIASVQLRDGDLIRVGTHLYRFLDGETFEADYHERIYRQAILDPLTGLHNRRYLMEVLERELLRAARRNLPMSILLLDIDHFKSINDQLGHLAGDCLLRELSDRLQCHVRKHELLARYGGEEFLLILPDSVETEALELAERLRTAVSSRAFILPDSLARVTVSIGVATTQGGERPTHSSLIRCADLKLYQAKHDGRDCVRS
ncbi:MAG: GGDEF domain-containing protein [Isosphaeraceae bacterium]